MAPERYRHSYRLWTETFSCTATLVVWDVDTSNRHVIDADEAHVTLDPRTGRLTASTLDARVAGSIRRSRPDATKDPVFLSCDLDAGTQTEWRLYGLSELDRKRLHEAYGEWLS